MTSGMMPYHLEKGPMFSVVEDWAAKAGWQGLLKFRDALLFHNAPAADVALDSVNLNAGPTPTYQDRVKHVNEDWFGWHEDTATGQWVQQVDTDFDPQTHPETGYWHNYFGDVEKIWRTTLIRAAEVALGLDHRQTWPEDQETPRCWPINFYWRCPNAWFETWITWRNEGKLPHEGMVIVHIHTPGHGSPILTSPLSPPNRSGPNFPEYIEEPLSANGTYGMWVTSQSVHNKHICAVPVRPAEIEKRRMTPQELAKWQYKHTHAGTGIGQVLAPHFGPVYQGTGGVVTVQPCEVDGGVLPQGRPY